MSIITLKNENYTLTSTCTFKFKNENIPYFSSLHQIWVHLVALFCTELFENMLKLLLFWSVQRIVCHTVVEFRENISLYRT